MTEIEPDEFPFRNGQLQVMAQDVQLLRTVKVGRGAEIVGHNEAASSDVLAEIRDLFGIEIQKARLR